MSIALKTAQMNSTSKRPWFLVLRVILSGLLIGSGYEFLKGTAFNHSLLIIHGLLTFVLIAYGILRLSQNERYIRILIIAILSCELLIEGLLVNNVGGSFSPFILFFIITIVTAALFFRLLGSILVATVSGLFYALPIFFNLSFLFDGLIETTGLTAMGISSDEAFYTVFLHLCLFYLSAFIAGYLAENLFLARQEISEIRLETSEILEYMQSGLMTVDASGRIIYFNKTAGSILAVDRNHARGKFINDFFGPGINQLTQRLEIALNEGIIIRRDEININHPERGMIPIGLSITLLKNDEGNTRGAIAIFQDLTEAKKLEARMRATDRLAAVGQMAAGIAHEIRNPLASIAGSVEVLQESLQLNGDDKRLLDLILKESARLNTILTDFLNFARISKTAAGKCDLGRVVNEVVLLASGDNRISRDIVISYKRSKEPVIVDGTEDQFKQILWNLIINSVQAIGNQGTILIGTENIRKEGGRNLVKLTVIDDGPGIPENIRERIFDPFFSTKGGGTGLGLPIVARIIECLDGKIEVKSGDGRTEFTILVPAKSYDNKDNVMKEMALA